MALELILQGLTKRTHAEALTEMLAQKDIERVILSVAFVTESGVEVLEKALKPLAARTTVFAGIRNDITSAQALKRLLKIGVKTLAVDTGSRLLLFHPKLYLVGTKSGASLSVGSANLTLGGLNNNVEAGIILQLDASKASDKKVLDEFIGQFDGLSGAHPSNVIEVTSTLIDELLASGRVVDEMALPPPRPSTSAKTGSKDATPRMRMKVAPLRKTPRKAKKPTKPTAPAAAAAVPAVPVLKPTTGVDWELMWVSKELTRRDLNIPLSGRNTNVTGSINLDKGMMEESVDHRHYFREVVFDGLNWPKKSGQVDQAVGSFALTIKGVDHGTFDLTVRHTTSTTSATYRQRNAMTRLSWGDVKDIVQDRTLLNRRMALYRDEADPTHFMIEID